MRLIDADALIDKTDDRYSLHEIGRRERDDIVDALEYAPTIQPEPHWIPVEQALPKIGEYVLCGTTAPYFGKYHVCKFVDKDKWIDKPHFDWERNGSPHVVAWTRFEPYKGVTT